MKTPEETKHALTYCAVGCNRNCPYYAEDDGYDCWELLVADALSLINQLESRLED